MITPRIIPCLLLKGLGLVKTVGFREPKYVGDPRNAVRIFNEKEADELLLLDITATLERRRPRFEMISDIASECFMPFGYGGGICSLDDVRCILGIGAEKVVINTHALTDPGFVEKAAGLFGSQSIVVCLDVKRQRSGRYEVFVASGTKGTGTDAVAAAVQMQHVGAGELIINSIDRDGTMAGYDLDLIRSITQVVSIPVVACGGAGTIQHLAEAIRQGGASAAAAGSLFVFQGKHRAVLISFPSEQDREAVFA